MAASQWQTYSANLIAKKVRIIRDEVGEELYGKEEWLNMQELGKGWQDFLCANHSKNLHFDAFSRGYSGCVKEKLGDGLVAARLRCGGRLRIEPDCEAFIRSICKLIHVGPKQYAKGDVSPLSSLQATTLPCSCSTNPYVLAYI
jgi:hypothetical protein